MLVTGGAGFLGAHVAKALVAAGRRARILDDGSAGRWDRLERLPSEQIELFEGDTRSVAAVEECMRGVAGVVHLAGRTSQNEGAGQRIAHDVNVTGTLNVITASQRERVTRFIFISTEAVYGIREASLLHEDMPIDPRTPLGAQAAFVEHHLRALHTTVGFPSVVLRVFQAYGPGEQPDSPSAGPVAKLIGSLSARRPPILRGDGHQVIDLVYVDDVAKAILASLELPAAVGQTFNIASGEAIGITALYELLASIEGSGPSRPAPRYAPPRPEDRHTTRAALSRACRELHYVPRVRLREGLMRTVEALRPALARSRRGAGLRLDRGAPSEAAAFADALFASPPMEGETLDASDLVELELADGAGGV